MLGLKRPPYLVAWRDRKGRSDEWVAPSLGAAVRRARRFAQPGCWALVVDSIRPGATFKPMAEYGVRFAALQSVAQRSEASQAVSPARKPMGRADAQAELRAREERGG